MGAAAQKKKHFDGLSAKNAKPRLAEIFTKECPSVTLNRMNKNFAKSYGISFLALAETWHRLRSQNKTMELVIQSFASSIARKNEQNHALAETIHHQREQLAKLQNEFNELKEARNGTSSKSLKQESALCQTPQVAEGENAESTATH